MLEAALLEAGDRCLGIAAQAVFDAQVIASRFSGRSIPSSSKMKWALPMLTMRPSTLEEMPWATM